MQYNAVQYSTVALLTLHKGYYELIYSLIENKNKQKKNKFIYNFVS